MKKILLVEVPDTYDETYMNLDVRFYDPVLGDLDNDGEVICEYTELTLPTEAEIIQIIDAHLMLNQDDTPYCGHNAAKMILSKLT